MTLEDLFEILSKLPGHENLVFEEYRITQEMHDPGNPGEAHYYLTGPDRFYLYLSQIDQGEERNIEEYVEEAMSEAEGRA